MVEKHLILGCGPAGLNAAEKIRETNKDNEVKLVSMEDYLPYCPASLPYLIADRIKEADLWLRDEDYFRKKDITFVKGKQAVRVLPDKKQVLYLDGDVDEYDTLLIATGAQPAIPSIEGLMDIEFLNFHTFSDYKKLKSSLGKGEIIIVGAGMVAVELAAALVEKGTKVNLVGRGRPLRKYFDETPGTYIREILIEHGIQINTGRKIERIKKTGDSVEIVCADGEVFGANLLIFCSGVRPKISFLDGCGIEMNQGIVVDSQLRTNIKGIYAAGDAAEACDFFSRQPAINATLTSAIDQGTIAGENISGKKSSNYRGWIPMNVVNMFDNSVFSIGILTPNRDEGRVIIEEKDDQRRYFKRLVFRDGTLVGGMFVNTETDPGIIRYLIENRINIDKYKEILFFNTRNVSQWLMLEAERGKLGS